MNNKTLELPPFDNMASDEALEHAKKWVEELPLDLKALQFCGLVYAKRNDLNNALDFFKRALDAYPNEVSCHTNLSNVYVSLGQVEKAMQHLHQALRCQPNHIESYNNLGRLLYKQGRILEAMPCFEKAIRIEPNFWEAHYNLAHSLSSQNLLNRAAAHYEQVIRLVPTHSTAHFNLGLIYFEEADFILAKQHLEKALEWDPDNTEAARILGQAYTQLGFIQDAIAVYLKALLLCPTLDDVHHNLAILYLRQEERSKALEHFKLAFNLDPKNLTAMHMIQSLSGTEASHFAPQEYVSHLFDQYADHYDSHLKGQLKYDVPGLLRNAVGRSLGINPKAGRILDLGCGTGLTGITFCDLAKELIGVDLSANMLEKAKLLEAYKEVVLMDLLKYLEQSPAYTFDIILAADVFVYSGDLEKIFKEVQRNLVANGLFAFTIESHNIGSNSQEKYQLQQTGRFQHSQHYIVSLAQKYDLKLLLAETITLRTHNDAPIPGCLFVLKSSESA